MKRDPNHCVAKAIPEQNKVSVFPSRASSQARKTHATHLSADDRWVVKDTRHTTNAALTDAKLNHVLSMRGQDLTELA
jgi:hypothetical protein